MKYTPNAVFTVVREALLEAAPNAFITSKYVPLPSKFPAVFARQTGSVQLSSSTTLTHDDYANRNTFECQFFSNLKAGASEEAYKMFWAANDALQRLAYILDYCSPVDNADPSIYRLVARWHRTTGPGESLPEN